MADLLLNEFFGGKYDTQSETARYFTRFFEQATAMQIKAFFNNLIASDNHLTKEAFKGAISLFVAEESFADSNRDKSLGWKALTKDNLRVNSSPGNHYSMLKEPHVSSLVRAIEAAIANSFHTEKNNKKAA
jgi:thioesterase domain-containing protein